MLTNIAAEYTTLDKSKVNKLPLYYYKFIKSTVNYKQSKSNAIGVEKNIFAFFWFFYFFIKRMLYFIDDSSTFVNLFNKLFAIMHLILNYVS